MKRIMTLVLGVMVFIGATASSLTISPQLREKLQREGAWEEFSKQFRQWHEQLEAATSKDALFKPSATLDANGVSTMKVVVILVDFSDNPASAGVTGVDTATFRDLLFSENPSSPRSLTDFYLENSYGKLVVEGGVFGWYRMPELYSQYVGTGYGLQRESPNAQTLVIDALTAADPTINFADYQNASYGIDAVFIVHAGKGAEEGGDASALWSHRSSTFYVTGEGTVVTSYIVGPEEEFGHQSFVGVYCHEFGHILYLPDLYDIGNSDLAGVGYWSLMASGSWNGSGQWPAHLDAWCKNKLDYGKCVTISDSDPNLVNVTLGSSANDTLRYKILLPGASFKEYFLVENRQQISFDRNLPGSGLLILHCDDNLSGSNDIRHGHWHVSVEQADGLGDLEVGRNGGDANDVFPGPANLYTEFTNLTKPNTASYYGFANQAAVWNITQNTTTKTVTFNLDATFSRVNLQLTSKSFNDAVYGNGDGVLVPGERVRLYYTIKNNWEAVNGVTVKVTSPTPGIAFNSNQNSFGNLAVGQVKSDSTSPVDFTLALGMQPASARFDLTITTTSPADTFVVIFYQLIGPDQSLWIQRILIEGSSETAHVVEHLPRILWQSASADSSSPSVFEIAVGTDSDWTIAEMWNPVPFNSSDTFVVYNGSPLLDGTTYWLRLRVNNSLAWSEWKQLMFRMNSVPTMPQPLTPSDGQTVMSSTPSLVIGNSYDADNVVTQVQYPPVIPTPVWTHFASTDVRIGGHPAPVGTMIDAFDPQGIHCGSIVMSSAGIMMMPVYGDEVLTPSTDEGCVIGDLVNFRINGAIASTPDSDTHWTGVGPLKFIRLVAVSSSDSLFYTFEVSPDSFAATVFTFTKKQDADSLTTLIVDSTLTENGQYWWRVKASDYYEESGYSPVWSFYVNSANTAPAAVSLTHPANTIVTPIAILRPQFVWAPATDPDPYDVVTYSLLIAMDSNCAFGVQIPNLTDTSHTLTTDLQWDKRYWWKVKANDLNGGSTWSTQVFTFRTMTLGDADGDGSVTIADVVFLINYIFMGGAAPQPAMAGDPNCDGSINIADAVYLINYIFSHGPAPCANPE